MEKDAGLQFLADAAIVGCALTALVLFFGGWRSDTAATVFVVSIGYLVLLGFVRR